MTVIGVIPFVNAARPSIDRRRELVEAFRALRIALRAQFAPGVPITCTITSHVRGAGKSFVAANLSLNFADAGFRTLLLDADAHSAGTTAVGRAEVPLRRIDASARQNIEASVYPTPYERLCVLAGRDACMLTAGAPSGGHLTVIDQLSAAFDVVIVDGPWWGVDGGMDEITRQTSGYLAVRRDSASSGEHTTGQAPPPIAHLGDIVIGGP